MILGCPTENYADTARINTAAVEVTMDKTARTAEAKPNAELTGLGRLITSGIPAGTDLAAERRVTVKLPDHVVDHVAVAVVFGDAVILK